MKIDWRSVLRDALAVLLLGFLGGWVGAAIGGDASRGIRIASTIVMMTAGFCLSGCLAKRARFKHLTLVAVGVWLIGTIVSAISADGSFVLSLSDIGWIAVAMLLGGLVSLAIVRPPPAAEPPASPPPA
ncbi:MAG: hypothetical protein JRS35_22150 [Deltaproteobacteria bacterium]|nr:hypothetical protein [Deltaproteobacteria bacterium]